MNTLIFAYIFPKSISDGFQSSNKDVDERDKDVDERDKDVDELIKKIKPSFTFVELNLLILFFLMVFTFIMTPDPSFSNS
jgi:hypothetical protein